MFKQIFSFKEIFDLSQKKADLTKVYSAKLHSRLNEILVEDNDERTSEISINMQFSQDSSLQPLLEGEVTVNLSLKCHRCLRPINWQDKIIISIGFNEDEDEQVNNQSQVDKIEIEDEGISIQKIVEDEILSTMPMSVMHKSIELCENTDTLGMFLSTSLDKAKEDTKNKPFSELSDMMKKNHEDF